MDQFGTILNVLLGAGATSMLIAAVASIRKFKAGEIVDDDAVIARLDKDNQDLRKQVLERDMMIEAERRQRWRAEDLAAEYRRRLSQYEKVENE